MRNNTPAPRVRYSAGQQWSEALENARDFRQGEPRLAPPVDALAASAGSVLRRSFPPEIFETDQHHFGVAASEKLQQSRQDIARGGRTDEQLFAPQIFLQSIAQLFAPLSLSACFARTQEAKVLPVGNVLAFPERGERRHVVRVQA